MVAAQTEAEVKAGFALAQHCPRNEERARVNIINSCKNLKFAEKCIYQKPVGWKDLKETNGKWERLFIEGPSIRFAEEVIRNWGNIKVQQITIYDDSMRRIVRVICYDLQTNIPYSEDIIIEKTVERKNAKDRIVIDERVNSKNERIAIVVATEDEVMNKEKALVSKAIRNNGLRLVPSHIVEEAMDVARETMKLQVNRDPMLVRRKIVDSFKTLGIEVDQIETYLNCSIGEINASEIENLQKIYNSIKEGHAKWSDFIVKDNQDAQDKGTEKAPLSQDQQVAEDWDQLEQKIQSGDPSKHTPPNQSSVKKGK